MLGLYVSTILPWCCPNKRLRPRRSDTPACEYPQQSGFTLTTANQRALKQQIYVAIARGGWMNCKMSRDEQDARRRKEKSIPSKHRHFEYKYSDIEQDVLALVDV